MALRGRCGAFRLAAYAAAIGAACGVCASSLGDSCDGSGVVYAEEGGDRGRSFSADGATQATLGAFGLPSESNVRTSRGFISSVNYERRIPNWVMEHIPHTKPKPKKNASANGTVEENKGGTSSAPVSRTESKFYSDDTIPEMFRATNADYARRGLSRGHLAAAQFHKGSQAEMDETFNLNTNIVPQDMTMNACDWYRLESMTKKMSKEFEKGLWVVSGPMFVPIMDIATGKRMVSYELVGNHDVAVPTHLFKCLLGVKEDNTKYQACFVLPNAPIPVEQPLTQYLVPASYVERTTGLSIFPKASSGVQRMFGPSPPAEMCRKFKCEGSYGSFSKSYRQVGRVRAATTEAEVKLTYAQLYQDGAVDAAVERELHAKLRELGVKDLSKYRSNA